MVKNLNKHIQEIKQFDRDRIFWLRLSGFVAIVILLLVIDWAFLGINNFYWILVSVGMVLSATWWYWTMKLIRELLAHRLIEIEILSELVNDVKEIRKDVKKIDQNL